MSGSGTSAMPGNRTAQTEGIKSLLEDINECQQRNNVPVYIGEFHIFDFYDLWKSLLSAFNQKLVSVSLLILRNFLQ